MSQPLSIDSPVISSERFADACARFDRAEARADGSARRFRVIGGVLLGAITVAVVAPIMSPAVAQGYGVTLASLDSRLTTAEGKIATLQISDASQQSAISDLKTRQQADVAALKTSITSLQASDASQQNAIAALQASGASGASRQIAAVALQTKMASMSAISDPNTNQPTVRFTNVNVQVVSGTGATDETANGRGNLIVGYNETRASGGGSGDIRTGSHNLVVGERNNYIGLGGVVFGYENTISGIETSVLGGQQNTASGAYSSVSGGYANAANGLYASVSGGYGNTASGVASSVSSGQFLWQSANFGWSAGGNGGVGTYHTP